MRRNHRPRCPEERLRAFLRALRAAPPPGGPSVGSDSRLLDALPTIDRRIGRCRSGPAYQRCDVRRTVARSTVRRCRKN